MSASAITPKTRRPRKTLEGVVESDRRDKSIKVVVNYLTKHRMYGKFMRRRTAVHAHDPQNEARVGDTVELMECRPMSKTKSWRLVRITRRGS